MDNLTKVMLKHGEWIKWLEEDPTGQMRHWRSVDKGLEQPKLKIKSFTIKRQR